MNKSTLILVLLSGVAGFSLVWMWLTGWNPLTAVTHFISDPAAVISELVTVITRRLDIVATVAAVSSAAIGFGRYVVDKVKSTAKDTENLLKGELINANQTAAEASIKLEAAETKATELTTRITQLETDKTKLNDTITEQLVLIERLRNETGQIAAVKEAEITENVLQEIRKP